MKKAMKTVLACALAVSALVVSSAAANFDHCADALSDLGLFQGSAQGYELDRAPTRAEAATMLVRLLGKEEEAKALTYTAPFTDLKGWEEPYVQYLYDNKLTSGMTETTFAPGDKCSAKMYTTFLLRALGYSDAAQGDFTYNDAVKFAKSIGLADYANCNETSLLRDHVAAMSYTALACPPKGVTDKTLLETLAVDGAVDKTKAAAVQKTFDTYIDYLAVSEIMAIQTKMDMDMDVAADVKTAGVQLMQMTMPMNVKADMKLTDIDKSKMALTGTMKLEMHPDLVEAGQPTTNESAVTFYFTDGVFYIAAGEQKFKMPISFAALQEQMSGLTGMSAAPISMIKSIEKTGSTYSLTYQMSAMNGMLNSMLGSMGQTAAAGDMSMRMGEVTAKMTVKNDRMDTMEMTMGMGMSMTVEGKKLDVDVNMTVNGKVNALGDSVKIDLPADFSEYKALPAA